MLKIIFDPENCRSIAYLDRKYVGQMVFVRHGHYWDIKHCFVLPQHREQEIAKRLMKKVMEQAEKEGMKILPTCSFAQKECDENLHYAKMTFLYE
ncbi:MAG: GNAT family N-acetyltransferase [Anaerovoracaceae bacterium]|jgi:predicted GNAT family acetyltransferase